MYSLMLPVVATCFWNVIHWMIFSNNITYSLSHVRHLGPEIIRSCLLNAPSSHACQWRPLFCDTVSGSRSEWMLNWTEQWSMGIVTEDTITFDHIHRGSADLNLLAKNPVMGSSWKTWYSIGLYLRCRVIPVLHSLLKHCAPSSSCLNSNY